VTLCVVGIGASAGGLDAISELLGALPPRTGLACIVVQHLDPHHESRLPEILARTVSVPVAAPVAGELLQADLAEVRRVSATSIANYEENKQLKASNESLQKQVTQLSERVRELDRNVMLRWLLAGGALVLVGLVIGALIKSRPKRSTWA